MLENLALRHQLMVLRRASPKPKLQAADRFLWALLQGCWSKWQRALVFVQPRTVLHWHRKGFSLFWRWKSRPRTARPRLDLQLVSLIRQMWSANPTWGSKRIQAELAKLGLNVSDSTIRKYRPSGRRTRSPPRSCIAREPGKSHDTGMNGPTAQNSDQGTFGVPT